MCIYDSHALENQVYDIILVDAFCLVWTCFGVLWSDASLIFSAGLWRLKNCVRTISPPVPVEGVPLVYPEPDQPWTGRRIDYLLYRESSVSSHGKTVRFHRTSFLCFNIYLMTWWCSTPATEDPIWQIKNKKNIKKKKWLKCIYIYSIMYLQNVYIYLAIFFIFLNTYFNNIKIYFYKHLKIHFALHIFQSKKIHSHQSYYS